VIAQKNMSKKLDSNDYDSRQDDADNVKSVGFSLIPDELK